MPNSDCNDEASSVCSGSARRSSGFASVTFGHREARPRRHTFRTGGAGFSCGVSSCYFDVGAAVGDRRPRLRGRLNVARQALAIRALSAAEGKRLRLGGERAWLLELLRRDDGWSIVVAFGSLAELNAWSDSLSDVRQRVETLRFGPEASGALEGARARAAAAARRRAARAPGGPTRAERAASADARERTASADEAATPRSRCSRTRPGCGGSGSGRFAAATARRTAARRACRSATAGASSCADGRTALRGRWGPRRARRRRHADRRRSTAARADVRARWRRAGARATGARAARAARDGRRVDVRVGARPRRRGRRRARAGARARRRDGGDDDDDGWVAYVGGARAACARDGALGEERAAATSRGAAGRGELLLRDGARSARSSPGAACRALRDGALRDPAGGLYRGAAARPPARHGTGKQRHDTLWRCFHGPFVEGARTAAASSGGSARPTTSATPTALTAVAMSRRGARGGEARRPGGRRRRRRRVRPGGRRRERDRVGAALTAADARGRPRRRRGRVPARFEHGAPVAPRAPSMPPRRAAPRPRRLAALEASARTRASASTTPSRATRATAAGASASVLLLPCAHLAICRACAKEEEMLRRCPAAEAAEGLVAPLRECVCPRCAEPVEHTLQTFDA